MLTNNDDQLQLALALVTSKGLNFNGIIYTNAIMLKNKWFEHAERVGAWPIPILFWHSNQDNLLIFESGSYVIASAVENQNSSIEGLEIYHEKLRALKEKYFEKNKKR